MQHTIARTRAELRKVIKHVSLSSRANTYLCHQRETCFFSLSQAAEVGGEFIITDGMRMLKDMKPEVLTTLYEKSIRFSSAEVCTLVDVNVDLCLSMCRCVANRDNVIQHGRDGVGCVDGWLGAWKHMTRTHTRAANVPTLKLLMGIYIYGVDIRIYVHIMHTRTCTHILAHAHVHAHAQFMKPSMLKDV
jgi:hypothetical protein